MITLDFWEDLYFIVMATAGSAAIIFFLFSIFFCSFFLMNLILAVVVMSYADSLSSSSTSAEGTHDKRVWLAHTLLLLSCLNQHHVTVCMCRYQKTTGYY